MTAIVTAEVVKVTPVMAGSPLRERDILRLAADGKAYYWEAAPSAFRTGQQVALTLNDSGVPVGAAPETTPEEH